jgi:hypothetical protein
MVCGSGAGGTVVRGLCGGGPGRAPARGFAVVIARAGAGGRECVAGRDGPGRVAAAAAGPAAARAGRMLAGLVRLARERHAR